MLVLYRVYQIFVMIPVLLVATIVAATLTILGSLVGAQRVMGYWPGHLWARLFCAMSLVRVRVRGRENIDRRTSYVFVANHQGAYDIFAIYGYLRHNFRWMMKKSLEKIPFVGFSCKISGHIFVDNSTPSATAHTMAAAEKQLSGGMSVVVFPEGSRSRDGKMHGFRRGAFKLATEFSLPVVPITIDGAYRVMRRGSVLPHWGTINLTIHEPIEVSAETGRHELTELMERSSAAIASALPASQRP